MAQRERVVRGADTAVAVNSLGLRALLRRRHRDPPLAILLEREADILRLRPHLVLVLAVEPLRDQGKAISYSLLMRRHRRLHGLLRVIFAALPHDDEDGRSHDEEQDREEGS